ncbi:MAG: ribonuclease HI family protein [Myxococcales bacterium]|nr:ribonuclease HI family protein [Myxococcales bacterium]
MSLDKDGEKQGARDEVGGADARARDVLWFIAREEPLAATLRRFPDLSRREIGAMLERLASAPDGVKNEVKASAGTGSEPVPPAASGELVLFTDGASRGNPGLAGAGVVLQRPDGSVVAQRAVFLGTRTNNEAEYEALLIGLALAREFAPGRLEVRLDSELVVRQLNGQYRVRHPGLIPLHRKAQELLRAFPNHRVLHVMREQNTRADELSNRAIDERR